MKSQIDRYIANSSLIKIDVDVEGDEDEYTGIPVRLSRSLLALHDLDDFHFDGYRIVKLKYVTKIRRSRFEVTQQKILKATGEIKNHAGPVGCMSVHGKVC